jgi:hypothetical protein
MTTALLNNRFLMESVKGLLDPDLRIDYSTRREVLILFKNIAAGYSIDISYRLVYEHNVLGSVVSTLETE